MNNRELRKGNVSNNMNLGEAFQIVKDRNQNLYEGLEPACRINEKPFAMRERGYTFHGGDGEKSRTGQKYSRETFSNFGNPSPNFNMPQEMMRTSVLSQGEMPFLQNQYIKNTKNNNSNFNQNGGKGFFHQNPGMSGGYPNSYPNPNKRRKTMPNNNSHPYQNQINSHGNHSKRNSNANFFRKNQNQHPNYNQNGGVTNSNNLNRKNSHTPQIVQDNSYFMNINRNSLPGVMSFGSNFPKFYNYPYTQPNTHISNNIEEKNVSKFDCNSSDNSSESNSTHLSSVFGSNGIDQLIETTTPVAEEKKMTPVKLKISEKINLGKDNENIFTKHKHKTTTILFNNLANQVLNTPNNNSISYKNQFQIPQDSNGLKSNQQSPFPINSSIFNNNDSLKVVNSIGKTNSNSNLSTMSYQKNLIKKFNSLKQEDNINVNNFNGILNNRNHRWHNGSNNLICTNSNNMNMNNKNFNNNHNNHSNIHLPSVKLQRRQFGWVKPKMSLSDKNLVKHEAIVNELAETKFEPFMTVQVKLPNSEEKEISLSRNENVNTTAMTFCEEHSLPEKLVVPIAHAISKAFKSMDSVLQSKMDKGEVDCIDKIYEIYQNYKDKSEDQSDNSSTIDDTNLFDNVNLSSITQECFASDDENDVFYANTDIQRLNVTM